MTVAQHLAHLVEKAESRIRPHTKTTPLHATKLGGQRKKYPVHLKLENLQHTGSFKARGSLNKLKSLTPDDRSRHIYTASTGNHGMGVARALGITGVQGTVYLPKNAADKKVAKLRSAGASLKFIEGGPLDSELTAKAEAAISNGVWVSPYNDIEIVAGQGTIGVELVKQAKDIQRVFATVGGGGLISGIAGYLKNHNPEIEIVGCVPENSPEMMLSVEAGHIVHLENPKETLSDGSAGGAEDGSITLEFCQKLVDSWIAVTEEEIAEAMALVQKTDGYSIEGSAGVAVAACLKSGKETSGDIVIICGGL